MSAVYAPIPRVHPRGDPLRPPEDPPLCRPGDRAAVDRCRA